MKTFIILSALGSLIVSTCAAELDWTFHPRAPGIDAPSPAYATSMLDAGEIRYVPPRNWTISGTRFIPPGKLEADAFVNVVPISAPAEWTPDRMKAVSSAILSQMSAKGASNITILSQDVLQNQIPRQTTYELCFSYTYYGQAYTKSIVFVELGKLQLQFNFGCLKDDFATLHTAFARSLRSVQGPVQVSIQGPARGP